MYIVRRAVISLKYSKFPDIVGIFQFRDQATDQRKCLFRQVTNQASK